MIDAGRAYVSANKLFVNGIKDLSQQCKKEEAISVSGGSLKRTSNLLHIHRGVFEGLDKGPLIYLY